MEHNKNPKEPQKVEVVQYVYEKVKKSDVIINIPQEPIYFQEYNHRIIIGLFPVFADWKGGDNSLYAINVIKITNSVIQKTSVPIHAESLSRILSTLSVKNKSEEDYLKDKVVIYLKDFFTDDRVSKEVFVAKYNSFLNELSFKLAD